MKSGKRQSLAQSEIRSRLKDLPGWKHSRGALRREFGFQSFLKGLQFVNRVARAAEKADHHPDIDIRYSTIGIALSTHDAKGITDKDFSLARVIDRASAVGTSSKL